MNTPNPHQRCGTCFDWIPSPDVNLAGYGNCRHLPDCKLFSGSTGLCQTKPIMWKAKQ